MDLESLLHDADGVRRLGDYESAAALYEQVLRARSNSAKAAAGLGICLERLGRLSSALQYLSKVASYGSEDPAVFASLGLCYFKLDKMDTAAVAYRRAVELDPESPGTLVGLAHTLVKLGEVEEAERSLLKAIEQEPELAIAYDLMAFLLPQMGRFEEAKEFARKASALEPNNAAYGVRFVYGGKVKPEDTEFVEKLGRMAADLRGPDRIRVEYGLGKAMEDLGRYEDSLRHYVEANALSNREFNRGERRFKPAVHKHETDLLIDTFTEDELRLRSARGVPSQLPVFIVGMMRSGTTLTEQILSAHPEVGGAGELDFWVKAGPRLFNAGRAQVEQTVGEYLLLLGRLHPGKSRVCDKMPQNYMSLGPIHAALPQARIIHCRRDPRDTCLSIFTIPFTHHPPFAYSLQNIAFAYRQYQRIMSHWRTVLPKDRLLEVDYEELVGNQEKVSHRMVEFLGLEWNDDCLHPERNERVVNTPSRWQVRQPVYGTSVSRWKRFRPWLEPLLDDWSFADDL